MRLGRLVSRGIWSLTFDDLAGLDATGADAHALADAINDGFDRLQVHVPATAGRVVGVRDIVAELRSLAAEFTFLSHDEILQSRVAEDFPEFKPE
jgi:hypothetical protein